MLRKSERLNKKQFDEYFAAGKRHQFPHCTIIYTACPTLHASVVVGKKVSKLAVKRNLIRRRVYAQLYTSLKQTNTTGVFIVLVKPSFATLPRRVSHSEVAQNIAAVCKKT